MALPTAAANGVDKTFKRSYEYDAAGNRTEVHLGEERSIRYRYGAAGELREVTSPAGESTELGYDALYREVRRERPNDIVTEHRFDAAGRLVAVTNAEADGRGRWNRGRGNEELVSEAYLYNAAGERTHTVTGEGRITAYEYDAAGRLSEVRYPFETAPVAEDFADRLKAGLWRCGNRLGGDRSNLH